MVHYHNVEQKSDEWHKLREPDLTGSHATAIGSNGKGLKTYAKSKARQKLGIEKKNFINADMERGNEEEPLALSAYEFKTASSIREMGYITNDKFINVGVSPDGLVDKDPEGEGGVEVKARNDEKHFSLILGETTEIPFNQIQMTLLVTERKWWDFVSFNPNFSKPLFIKRIYPDLKHHTRLEEGFINGNKLIVEYLEIYKKYK